MTETELLFKKIDEQDDELLSQCAQMRRMNNRIQSSDRKINKLNLIIAEKNRLLKRVEK